MTGSYQNPADTGLVEKDLNCSDHFQRIAQNKCEAIARFFQYRPLVNEEEGTTNCVSTDVSVLCIVSSEQEPNYLQISFPSISIKPTHISLR